MQRNCDVCGAAYQAQRSTSKYCSPSCRARKAQGARKRKAEVVSLPAAEEKDGSVEAATRAELDAAGQVNSALGQSALALARRLDEGRDPGTGLASMVRQLQTTLAAALADAQVDEDPLDELAAWRERKVSAARGK